MKQILLVLSFIISTNLLFAQYVITGKVIDKTTGKALGSASVFAQNTTFGAITDPEGNFKLRLPDGGYDLAITYTGYETVSMRVSSSSANEPLAIELKPHEKSLEEVSIVASNEVKDGWKKYGDFFVDKFIGRTEFGKQAVVKNPEVLHFYFSKKRNRLKIVSGEPLIVENNALGYNIKYAMDSLIHEYNSNTTTYVSYPLFEEMTGTPAQQNIWKQNRQKAYNGSILHFMRSYYNKSLSDNGFEVQLKRNDSDPIFAPKKHTYDALNYLRDDSSRTAELKPNQPNMIIIYDRMKPEPAYLVFDPTARKDIQVSYLFIPQSIEIEENGYYFESSDIIINGYWGFEKIANMLPYDYKPGN